MYVQTVDLVKAFINSNHGWAVADQFQDTFNGGDFEDQNTNALDYIRNSVDALINSELLSDEVADELQVYLDRLEGFMFDQAPIR